MGFNKTATLSSVVPNGYKAIDVLCGAGGMTLASLKLRPVLRWKQTELFGKEQVTV